jgi:predicted phage terminase large subunit-like protein
LVVGIDPNDNIYVLDVWREQKTPDITTDAFIDLCKRWKPMAWGVDKDLMTKSVGPFVRKRMDEQNVYTVIEELALGRQDKAMRAQAIRGRTAMGKLYLPSNAPWVTALKSEMLSFPVGVHDDQVDTLGIIGRMLDEMVAANIPPPDEDNRRRSRYTRPPDKSADWMLG